MTATPADVRQAICNLLAQNVQRSTSWFAYPVPLGAGNYPAGRLMWASTTGQYNDTFDPTDTVLLDLELAIRGELVTANQVMDDYLWRGTGSAIVDALEVDATLDGLVMDVSVTGADVEDYPGPDEDYTAKVHLRVML